MTTLESILTGSDARKMDKKINSEETLRRFLMAAFDQALMLYENGPNYGPWGTKGELRKHASDFSQRKNKDKYPGISKMLNVLLDMGYQVDLTITEPEMKAPEGEGPQLAFTVPDLSQYYKVVEDREEAEKAKPKGKK